MAVYDLYFVFLFLPIVLFSYYMVTDGLIRRWLLILASLFFYVCGSPSFFLMLLALTIGNIVLSRILIRNKGEKTNRGKYLLVAGIIINLAILVYYKYAGVAADLFYKGDGCLPVLLPLGLSFYVFKAVSFLTDSYRGKLSSEYPVSAGVLYLTFFGQLSSGPLSRARSFQETSSDTSGITKGLPRFMAGFCKKVLLADVLAGVVASVYENTEPSTALAWLGSICFSLQLYYDFSGYSDMAIGLTNLFGYECPENFNYPYATSSISEFWRRWHITLGTWFRDYVYIPLGGSRVSSGKIIRNLLVVWLLTGIWHGTGWNFILWGLGYFLLIVFEKLTGLPDRLKSRVGKSLYQLAVLIFINLLWVPFRAENMGEALRMLRAMFIPVSNDSSAWAGFLLRDNIMFIVAALIFCAPVIPALEKFLSERLNPRKSMPAKFLNAAVLFLLCVMFFWAVSFLVAGENHPFAYANF